METSKIITDWIIAVGTIAVVIIAVFQDQVRSWLNRPRLEITISPLPPDCHKSIMTRTLVDGSQIPRVTLHSDCYYFRIRVRNVGNQRAENVEVFATELLKQKVDGSFERVNSFLPMNLLWSHVRAPFIAAISPGMEKLCDLGHIIDPVQRKKFSENNPTLDVSDDQTTFSLEVEVIAYTMGHVFAPGKYLLKLLIGAANSKPMKKTVEISLTGKWYSDERIMLSEGVGIRML